MSNRKTTVENKVTAIKLEKHDRASRKSATQAVADEKSAGLTKSLEARPKKQPIDYAKMRKDIKVRFSKTLAHLAK